MCVICLIDFMTLKFVCELIEAIGGKLYVFCCLSVENAVDDIKGNRRH